MIVIQFGTPRDIPIILPTAYKHAVQGLCYNFFGSELSTFLHDRPYMFNNKIFKCFAISDIMGRFRINNHKIVFAPDVSLAINSSDERVINEIESYASTNRIWLLKNTLIVNSIKIIPTPDFGNNGIRINMLSPLTMYKKTTNKKTHFISPYSEEFPRLIEKNMKDKYQAFSGKKPKATKFDIQPISISRHSVNFKGFTIEAWQGEFMLYGDTALLRFAFETGIGCNNSAGFGLWEVSK